MPAFFSAVIPNSRIGLQCDHGYVEYNTRRYEWRHHTVRHCWHFFFGTWPEVKMATIAKKSVLKNKNIADSYNRYKLYQGKQYTGMTIGRSHKWYYDKGIWIDKKITPDKWMISYAVTKRRAGKAPEGSGVPVGTEYHWYILAHQIVKKLDANSYSTELNGLKFKLAHKRKEKDKWNISNETQRKHLIKILTNFIKELETEPMEEFVEESRISQKKPAKKTINKKKVTR